MGTVLCLKCHVEFLHCLWCLDFGRYFIKLKKLRISGAVAKFRQEMFNLYLKSINKWKGRHKASGTLNIVTVKCLLFGLKFVIVHYVSWLLFWAVVLWVILD